MMNATILNRLETNANCSKLSKSTHSKTILLLGSSGFIGKQVIKALQGSKYALQTPSSKQVNFLQPEWHHIEKLCEESDIVINMVGVMSQDKNTLEQVHHVMPFKIAQLAKKFHVKRWINLSALGACPEHDVAFLSSKGRGDTALLSLNDPIFEVTVVRPSLVFGRGGASCEMFIRLAGSPLLILPNAGNQLVQPVHVKDVAEGIAKLASIPACPYGSIELKAANTSMSELTSIINMTGKTQCSLADYLTMLRCHIHNRPAPKILPFTSTLTAVCSSITGILLPSRYKNLINEDSLKLLEEGSVADNTIFSLLLGRQPIDYRNFKLNT